MNAPSAPACILFDLDGTLVDSVADISASANHVRTGLGLPPLPRAELAKYVGDGATMLMRRALAASRVPPDEPDGVDLEEALRAFRAHYHQHCLEHTRPYPGVVATLKSLAPLPMAIVSNKPEPMCVTIADGLGLRPYLPVVVGARPDLPVKPDPALLQIALDALGVAPASRVWMVGDSRNDVLAARALGLTSVAVTWGLGDPATLRTASPDRMIDRFEELLDAGE